MFWLLQDIVWEEEQRGETAGERKYLSSFKRSRWLQWKGKCMQDDSSGSRISPDLVKVFKCSLLQATTSLLKPWGATTSLPKPQGAPH